MHAWANHRSAGQQLTMKQMAMGDVDFVTAESVALCSPGEALIRHFFLSVHEARSPYQLSFRQQNVPMSIGAVDATFKRGKALSLLKIRQTVFSNDVNAPAIGIWCSSASMDDPAFVAACADYNKVIALATAALATAALATAALATPSLPLLSAGPFRGLGA